MVKSKLSVMGIATGLVLTGAVACNVESTGESTGGVDDEASSGRGDDDDADDADDVDDVDDVDDADDADDGGAVECSPGVTIVLSDYVSTQIALSTLEGETQSASFVSTASSETAGMAFALSGDVALPSEPPASGRIVLLDRFGTNVITWLDPKTAEALGQLPVGTGFESNPQDYAEIGDDLALVSRWGQNTDPGNEDFDRGGDVLVVDTDEYEIVDAIELPLEDELPPRPSSLLRVGDRVLVNLDRVSEDYATTGEATWASISIEDQEVDWIETLEGLKECGRPALSPDGSRMAMACTGALSAEGDTEALEQSALLIFDPSEDPPEEVERYTAEELAGEPIQDDVAYASEGVILFKTQTAWGGSRNNRLLALDLETGDTSEFLEARADDELGGKGLVYGAVSCSPGCSNVCLMADSDRGVLQRLQIDADGDVTLLDTIEVEDDVGLAPVGLTLR